MDTNEHVRWCLRQIAVLNPEGETWAYATAALNALGEATAEPEGPMYKVILMSRPVQLIEAVKALRFHINCTLKEARDFLDGGPGAVLPHKFHISAADALLKDIARAGGMAEMKKL